MVDYSIVLTMIPNTHDKNRLNSTSSVFPSPFLFPLSSYFYFLPSIPCSLSAVKDLIPSSGSLPLSNAKEIYLPCLACNQESGIRHLRSPNFTQVFSQFICVIPPSSATTSSTGTLHIKRRVIHRSSGTAFKTDTRSSHIQKDQDRTSSHIHSKGIRRTSHLSSDSINTPNSTLIHRIRSGQLSRLHPSIVSAATSRTLPSRCIPFLPAAVYAPPRHHP